MLLPSKLLTTLKFSALKLPVLKTAIAVGVAGLAWGTAEVLPIPSLHSGDLSAQQSLAANEKSAHEMQLHDALQYIGEKFSEEQQRLQHQPSAEVVQTF
jgi:hypothetical protein